MGGSGAFGGGDIGDGGSRTLQSSVSADAKAAAKKAVLAKFLSIAEGELEKKILSFPRIREWREMGGILTWRGNVIPAGKATLKYNNRNRSIEYFAIGSIVEETMELVISKMPLNNSLKNKKNNPIFNPIFNPINNKKKNAENKIKRKQNLCVGSFGRGCPDKSEALFGYSCCKPCQKVQDTYNARPEHHASVVRSTNRKRERDLEMEPRTTPIVQDLSFATFKDVDEEAKIHLLNLNSLVIVDSEKSGKGAENTGIATDEWVFLKVETGELLHLDRPTKRKEGSSTDWTCIVNGDKGGRTKISDVTARRMVTDFVGEKTLTYWASSNGCDFKGFSDWMSLGLKFFDPITNEYNYSEEAQAFKWFNLGWEVAAKLCGHKGEEVKTTGWELLHFYTYLYQVELDEKELAISGLPSSAITPDDFVPSSPRNRKCYNDVLQTFALAKAFAHALRESSSSSLLCSLNLKAPTN